MQSMKELIAVISDGNLSTIKRLKSNEPVAAAYEDRKNGGRVLSFQKIKEAKRAELRFYAPQA